MRELRDILDALRRVREHGEEAALATVVGVRGSTYRREGARLVIPRSGDPVGSISGGCLEGDVQIVAEEVMRTGRPRLLRYDLTADDEAVWGLGLGCNGMVDVFVEKVSPSVEAFLAEAVDQERPVAVLTVVGPEDHPRLGWRLVVHADGRTDGTLGDPRLDAEATALGRRALERSKPARLPVDGLDVFIEPIQPPMRLVVCGAGHDAIPLVRLAAELGFRPVVVDRREKFLTRERFPEAHGFVRTEFPEVAGAVQPDVRTCLVVMTHNYLHDKNIIRSFLTHPTLPAYLGLLGPRQRTQKILRELAAEGVHPSAELQSRIYAPVGLDIGAEGPTEIALAILAEILAALNGRKGGFLRDRPAAIHEPLPV